MKPPNRPDKTTVLLRTRLAAATSKMWGVSKREVNEMKLHGRVRTFPKALDVALTVVLLLVVALCLALVAGCGSSTQTLEDADDGTDVTLRTGDELVVKLEVQGGTGYSWQVVDDANGTLELQGEPTTEQADEAEDGAAIVGGVETQVFTFEAVESGTGTLNLEYKRSWETTAPAERTWAAEITVE